MTDWRDIGLFSGKKIDGLSIHGWRKRCLRAEGKLRRQDDTVRKLYQKSNEILEETLKELGID